MLYTAIIGDIIGSKNLKGSLGSSNEAEDGS